MRTFTHVRRYKRGARWPDGQSRLCVRCGIERTRRQQAVVTAKDSTGDHVVPVAYCDDHIPKELEQ